MAKVLISPNLEKNENVKAEILATRKIADAFKKNNDTIIYLRPTVRYSPLLGRTVEPDIVVFKQGIGTVIFEVKAWDKNFLEECNFSEGFLKCGNKKFIPPLSELKAFINDLLDRAGPPIAGLLFLPFLSKADYQQLPLHIKELIPADLTIFEEDYLNKELIRKKFFSVLARFSSRISQKEIEQNQKRLKRLLFPDINIANIEASLDEIQENLLFSLKKGYRIIRGGPGSGKTVTLMGKAVQSLLEDLIEGKKRKIVFLTFGKSLAEKVKEDIELILDKHGLKDYKNRIEVYTLHSYAGKILHFLYPNKKVEDTLEALLSEEIKIPEHFKPDVLLVDEVQDFRLPWFNFIKKLYKDNKTVLAFGVDETQRIYPDTEWKWAETPFPARGKVKILSKIYRTPARFINLGVEFLKKDPVLAKRLKELKDSWINNFETLKTESKIKLYTPQKTFPFIRKLIENLLKRYKPDEILVLTPFENAALRNYLKKELEVINQSQHFEPGKVNVLTYYRSKGLEAKAVIVVDFDRLFELKLKDGIEELRRLRRLGFVTLTRAQQELFILGREEKGAFKEIKEILEAIGES